MMIDGKLTTMSVAAALLGAITVATATASATAVAAEKAKCYGIAKAAENDCANAPGTHSCSGHSTIDYSGADWKVVASAEKCLIEGGMLMSFDGINPEKA